MSRTLIIVGLLVVIMGVLWPWLGRIGFGRLPGDLTLGKDGFRFYFPITTSIIVSLILTLLLWLFRK
ncbi:MAG: hypothetical protein B7Z66_02360 [Chromatiales bacterium 21-64-14]|nr:MAG: hypothetical protein B7Z66_02360 [Chromatiales bacterium 21-64-14]HQU16529.1 DUF2905 domain-containing protein [Gammaproteobacteria bacterium]